MLLPPGGDSNARYKMETPSTTEPIINLILMGATSLFTIWYEGKSTENGEPPGVCGGMPIDSTLPFFYKYNKKKKK